LLWRDWWLEAADALDGLVEVEGDIVFFAWSFVFGWVRLETRFAFVVLGRFLL
jgi:hypothetical protein